MHVHELAFPDACRDWDHAIRLKLQQTQRWSLAAGMTWNGTIKQSIGPYGYDTPKFYLIYCWQPGVTTSALNDLCFGQTLQHGYYFLSPQSKSQITDEEPQDPLE